MPDYKIFNDNSLFVLKFDQHHQAVFTQLLNHGPYKKPRVLALYSLGPKSHSIGP